MIPLNIQLKMITFSFCYGFIFFLILNFIKPLIYNKKFIIKFISSIFFSVLNGILYFFFLKIINDGILNINLVIMFLFGNYFSYIVCKVLLKKNK